MNTPNKQEELRIVKAIDTLREANVSVEFECTKCYERFNTDECWEHCKDKKHYSFRLLGTHLIRSFV